MITSHDAQLSSTTTTTTRMTRYFNATSMLIFSMRRAPLFPADFPHLPRLPSSSLRLPHFLFLTSLHLPHSSSSSPIFLTSSSSLHLPHFIFLTPSSSSPIFLSPSSSLRLPRSVFLTFRTPSTALHLLTFFFFFFLCKLSLPLSSPFLCLDSFPPD